MSSSAPPQSDASDSRDLNAVLGNGAMWSVERAASPLIGTAIHNGHVLRDEVAAAMALDAAERLREEDPFTEFTIRDVPNRVVFHRSRFEIDLNRDAENAVYRRPDQAWGLDVWSADLGEDLVRRSLDLHAAYYGMLEQMLSGIAVEFGQFVLLDVHSYNHRRDGAQAAPSDPETAPQINIGTFSMDRQRWAHVVAPFVESLRSHSLHGTPIDVRENVAFEGRGEQTRFVHANFPANGCAIAIEFKKFFMDEWTGEPDVEALQLMRRMIKDALPVLLDSLKAAA